MEKQDLASALLKKETQKEAWKNISGDYPLSENMLYVHRYDLDWEEVSANRKIHWDVNMLKKFDNRIDWTVFSHHADDYILTEEIIETFKDQWNWSKLSGNSNLPISFDLIDKFIDRWDWQALIANYYCNSSYKDKIFGMEFFNRYQQYIPAEHLEGSSLWCKIVEEEEEAIKKDLVMGGKQ